MVAYRHTHVGGVEVTHKSEPKESISVWLGRTSYDGMLAAVVESDSAKIQIAALLDLIDLHLAGKGADNGIALLLDQPHPEATAALEVLRDAATLGVPIHLLRYDGKTWVPIEASNFDHATADPHYRRWPKLLGADFAVPHLVTDLVKAVGMPEVRAYPQLTAAREWSIRVEGLQVGRVLRNGTGWLDVGKVGKTGELGPERITWLKVSPHGTIPFDPASLTMAANKIREFATVWRARAGGEQNEHVLESRILRGAVDVIVDGHKLELIRADDGIVNWGSQFPTKWGPGRSARYLDALLRDPVDPRVPWAIEMKVRLSEGQYYRQAVAQAVLYRQFIRLAEPLHFWFDPYGLDAVRCRAAVVVPEFKSSKWRVRLDALCSAFDVALATVPEAATHR